MTKDELVAELTKLAGPEGCDTEENHMAADGFLLKYIDDVEVTNAYHAIEKWHS